MPLHDWSDDRGWDSVHPLWLAYLVEHLQDRLPAGYRAYLGGVHALSVGGGGGQPDVRVLQWGAPPVEAQSPSAVGLLEPDLEVNVVFRLDPQMAVHVGRDGQLIAALELVSPRNKDRADAKETYANRYLGYLRLGVHLMLVDVLPRPRNFSFADAVTGGLGLELSPLPAPFAATLRAGEPVPVGDDIGSLLAVWRRPLRVSEPLPTLPLPLNVHAEVLVDLEETYQRAAKRAYLD